MLLRATNLWKTFQYKKTAPTTVLRGASIDVEEGEMVAVVGASGSGKSTLLNVLGLLERPDQGTILWEEEPIHDWPERKRNRFRGHDVGFIFQFYNLLPTLTVFENVRIVMEFGSLLKPQWTDRTWELLRMVGLEEKAKLKPHQLSGGEQQKVAIARALANRPRLLLADEPTGNLDSGTGMEIVDYLSRLVMDHGLSIIMVTHNAELATRAHRVCRMRDGEIHEVGVLPTWDAVVDPLTGAYNRRGLGLVGEKYTELRTPCAVLAFDIDHFKKVNDTYGHKTGDEVLKEVARRIGHDVRRGDTLVRNGGEEFLAILPHTSAQPALERAEVIRQAIAAEPIVIEGQPLSCTISVGCALFVPGESSWEEALDEADRYLYAAKQAGRNRVCWQGGTFAAALEGAHP